MTGYWRIFLILTFFHFVFLCEASEFQLGIIPLPERPLEIIITTENKSKDITFQPGARCPSGMVWSDDGNKCKALCWSGCENGVCQGRDKCFCEEPLILKHNNSCVNKPPNAKCGNTLESCQCIKGYTMKNGICTAVCSSECINGYCESPGKCSCKYGYMNNETDPNVCYEPPKDHFNHVKCTLGGECFCYCTMNGVTHGLIKVPKSKDFNLLQPCSKNLTCEPRCTHECINGFCVGRDVCECEPPLQLKDKYTCMEPKVKNKLRDCIWLVVCCVSVLIITAISFLCCMNRRMKYVMFNNEKHLEYIHHRHL